MRKPFANLWTGSFENGPDLEFNRLAIDENRWEFNLFDSSEGRLSLDLKSLKSLYIAIGNELREASEALSMQWDQSNTRDVKLFITAYTDLPAYFHTAMHRCTCIRGTLEDHITIHRPNKTYITMRSGDWVCIDGDTVTIHEHDPLRK